MKDRIHPTPSVISSEEGIYLSFCHCEEQSDAAIPTLPTTQDRRPACLKCHCEEPSLCHSHFPLCHSRESGNLSFSLTNNQQLKIFLPKKKVFYQLMQYINSKNHGGHSSFVFPRLCMTKSKVCPPFTIFLNLIKKKCTCET